MDRPIGKRLSREQKRAIAARLVNALTDASAAGRALGVHEHHVTQWLDGAKIGYSIYAENKEGKK